jgi:hypothetical protein
VTRRHALYFAALQAGGAPRDASPWSQTSPFMVFLTAVPTPERQRLLDLLGVRAVLVDARPAGRPPAVQALLEEFDLAARCRVPTARGSAPVEIYANPRALPRAFLVGGVAVAAGPEDALRQLLAPDFDPRRSAVGRRMRRAGGGAGDGSPGDARIVARQPARGGARGHGSAWLVLTGSFDPDWTATRNGEPVESASRRLVPRRSASARRVEGGVPLPAGGFLLGSRRRRVQPAAGLRAGATLASAPVGSGRVDREQLDLVDDRRAAWDARRIPARSMGQLGGADQPALPTHAHPEQRFPPAGQAACDHQLGRNAALHGAVENVAVAQAAVIVEPHAVAGARARPRSRAQLDHHQARRRPNGALLLPPARECGGGRALRRERASATRAARVDLPCRAVC